ncbi:MAG: ABC transporter permease [Planctomycetota bacterium]|nr:ABC transporter permease [Planctomycetota bacterium]
MSVASVLTPDVAEGRDGESGVAAALALTARELRRFVRQPSRVASSIGTPVLLWLFASAGLGGAMVVGDAGADGEAAGYAAFLLPGMATMVVLFSTIFAAISLIQDRQAGFLQSVLVSPAPAWAIVFSKVTGGAVIAAAQAAILLLGAPLAGLSPGPLGYAGAFAVAACTAIALTSLGLAAAWRVNSTAGFHGIMNMLLMPTWLLSGAIFPVDQAAGWLGFVARLNPLHWCVNAMARTLGAPSAAGTHWHWIGVIGFAAAMFAVAWRTIARGVVEPGSDVAG